MAIPGYINYLWIVLCKLIFYKLYTEQIDSINDGRDVYQIEGLWLAL